MGLGHNHAPGGSHTHDHAGDARAAGTPLRAALALTLAFALVEAIAGWRAGSLALIGDAGHMVSDAAALGLAAFAQWLARRPPSARHSYGLARAEIVAAFVNGIVMLLVVAGIALEAVTRLRTPVPVAGGAVALVAVLGLGINLAVLAMLRNSHRDLNTRGAMLHVVGDALGSVAALVAGITIYFTGWSPIDALASLAICALILYSTVQLLREALHVLMEGVPVSIDLTAVGRGMAAVADVQSVHDLHIWTLASGRLALSAHIVVADLNRWQALLAAQRRLLAERYDIDHVTLQPELAPPTRSYPTTIPIHPRPADHGQEHRH